MMLFREDVILQATEKVMYDAKRERISQGREIINVDRLFVTYVTQFDGKHSVHLIENV